MQSNGGLLGAFMGNQQEPSAPAGGGLLGAVGAPNSGLQMAQQLSQSPTPDTARQIIAQLHGMRNPEAAQFEEMLSSAMNDPQALKQLADAVMQKLGGGNA